MSFLSKSAEIQNQQLRVQEVCIRFADLGLYTASGSDVTIDLGEVPVSKPHVLHLDNSGPTCVMIAASAIAISSNSITVTLGAAFAANDMLIVKYIVSE
jgi:hypothetical protein